MIDDDLIKMDIGRYISYYEDITGELTINEISSEEYKDHFVHSDKNRLGFGYSRSVYWIRLTAENVTDHIIRWYLEYTYNLIDYLSLYKPCGDGFTVIDTGDNRPFDTRPVAHRTFLFPVKHDPGEITLYFRIKSGGSLVVPLIAWMPETFRMEKDREDIIVWISYGILIALVFYNLFIFFSIREKSYIYLVFVMVSFLLFALTNNGMAYQYLWPDSPVWNNSCYPFFTFLIIIGNLLFTRAFLNTKENLPVFDKVYQFITLICIPCSILPFLIDYYYAIQLVVCTAIVTALSMIAGGISAAIKRIRPACFYLISWSFFIIGSLLILLRVYTILPENVFTAWSFQIGFVIMSLLFSLGIADSINVIQSEKVKALDAFKKSEERYRSIFDNATEGIFQTSPEGRVLIANPATAKILGFSSPDELIQMAPDIGGSIFVDPGKMEDIGKLIIKKGHVKGFECNVYRKDGAVIFISVNAHAVRDNSNKVLYYEGIIEDITKKKEAEELDRKNLLLKQQVITDSLSGLYTYNYITGRLAQEIAESKRYGNALSIAMMDIDNFKMINDTYGSQIGDQILEKIASVIKQEIREVDIPGRYGGEEFLIIFPNTGGKSGYHCAERVRKAVEDLKWDFDITTTISGGIASWEGEDLEKFIKKSERLLHIAKHSGRNVVEI